MAVALNEAAFEQAQRLIEEGRYAVDDRDDWSAHQPRAEAENNLIAREGWQAYGRWHLGVDAEAGEETKGRYSFAYGDFENVHLCGVLAAESRAAQDRHFDIEQAVGHLHGMLEGRRNERPPNGRRQS